MPLRLLHKLSEFSASLFELIASFLTDRELKSCIYFKSYGGRCASSLRPCPNIFSLHTNDDTAAPGTHLALLEYETCIYETEKHERHVLCKLQRGLTAVNSWCELWNKDQ
jgi:hypothetical protein